MKVADNFLNQVRESNESLFKLFNGKIELFGEKKGMTITLTVHVFNSAKYSLKQLSDLQAIWEDFVKTNYSEFNISPLLVVGTALHRVTIETQWSVDPG